MSNVVRYLASFLVLIPSMAFSAGKAEHVVVVVWDGLRPDSINEKNTPTLHRMVQDGVMFQNHHSAYCSATEVNGTAMATGAYPEHSGIIANRMFLPQVNPQKPVDTQATDTIRSEDEATGGHYIALPTVAETLQAAGKRTVIAGSKQVALLHDRQKRTAATAKGVTLYEGKAQPESQLKSIKQLLGDFPPAARSGSSEPNEPRDQWTTHALLGPLWTNGVPEYSLLWLSEPDASQHAAGPGSPKALAALGSSDRRLAEVLAELERRGLRDKTDLFVVSDHGFSTVDKSVEIDDELRDAGFIARRQFSSKPRKGEIVIAGQGGSVLFYVIDHDVGVISRLVRFLQVRPFTGVIFTRDAMTGTFTLDQGLINSSNAPDVVMSMRWSDGKSHTGMPGLFFADGGRKPGDGTHASLSRFDLHNTLVAAGPDFKKGFANSTPSGNIDLAPTILWLLDVKSAAAMDGRILSEAMTVDAPPAGSTETHRLEAHHEFGDSTWYQYLNVSQVGSTLYLDEGNGHLEPKK